MHRREQIMQAVLAAVTGLATTGANVKRGRVYPLAQNTTAALSVYQGDDAPLPADQQSWPVLDAELSVYLDAHVKGTAEQLETELNQIATEVTVALSATAWRPAFVLDVEESTADDPAIDGAGEKPVGSMRLRWIITYRRSRTDPEN